MKITEEAGYFNFPHTLLDRVLDTEAQVKF